MPIQSPLAAEPVRVAPSILLVSPDPRLRELVQSQLLPKGFSAKMMESTASALEAISSSRFDLIISELSAAQIDGLNLLARVRERDPEQEFVFVTSRSDVSPAQRALRAGVLDCLLHPVAEADFQLAVERCLSRATLRQYSARLAAQNRELNRTLELAKKGNRLGGLRDVDTAAYNLSFFTEYSAQEICKSRRYGRIFSLLTVSMDQLTLVLQRCDPTDVKRAARGVVRGLSSVLRDSDIMAKATEQELYVLLPETDFFGASSILRRALAAARAEPEVKELETKVPLGLVGGAATFPRDGEDFDELLHACRTRSERRRHSLERQLSLGELPFWDEVELLLGDTESPPLPQSGEEEPSRRGSVSQTLFSDLQTEVSRELLRDPGTRGVVYLGTGEIRADLPLVRGLDQVPSEFTPQVYLLGRRADLSSHRALLPVFLEGDERIARHQFVLWLSETSSYALLQRPGQGATWGFQTSETAVVESLVSKLQTEYDLQPY